MHHKAKPAGLFMIVWQPRGHRQTIGFSTKCGIIIKNLKLRPFNIKNNWTRLYFEFFTVGKDGQYPLDIGHSWVYIEQNMSLISIKWYKFNELRKALAIICMSRLVWLRYLKDAYIHWYFPIHFSPISR